VRNSVDESAMQLALLHDAAHVSAALRRREQMTYSRLEAARELGVSHHSLYRWTKRGLIKPPKRIVHSGVYAYTDEDLKEIRKFMAKTEPGEARQSGHEKEKRR
jgi:hypothetical protein